MALRRAHVDPAVLDAVVDGRVALPPDCAHRFFRVLRLAAGAPVELFDGTGRVARGVLEPPAGIAGAVVVDAGVALPPLVVAQAVTRTEKLELAAQKSTELGASAFVLVACARGQVKLDEARAAKRRDRLQRIADDAARQSGRATAPLVEGPVDVDTLAARVRTFVGVAVVGVVDAPAPLSEALAASLPALEAGGLLVVVGPEGGLDAREVDALCAAGAVPVRLGTHVLRTETAAVVALAAAQVALGRL